MKSGIQSVIIVIISICVVGPMLIGLSLDMAMRLNDVRIYHVMCVSSTRFGRP